MSNRLFSVIPFDNFEEVNNIVIDQPVSQQSTHDSTKIIQRVTELVNKTERDERNGCIQRLWYDHGCLGKCAICGMCLGGSSALGVVGGVTGTIWYSFNHFFGCTAFCGCQPTCVQCAGGLGAICFSFFNIIQLIMLSKNCSKQKSSKTPKRHSYTIKANPTEVHTCSVCLEDKTEVGLHRCSHDKNKNLVHESSICKPCFKKLSEKKCVICKTEVDFP